MPVGTAPPLPVTSHGPFLVQKMLSRASSAPLLDEDDADGRGGGGTAWDGDFWVDTEAQAQLGSMFEVLRPFPACCSRPPRLLTAVLLRPRGVGCARRSRGACTTTVTESRTSRGAAHCWQRAPWTRAHSATRATNGATGASAARACSHTRSGARTARAVPAACIARASTRAV